MGDLNIDTQKYDERLYVRYFVDLMNSHGFVNQISLPTYVKGRDRHTRPIRFICAHEPQAGILSYTGVFLMGNRNIIEFPHILIRLY